MPRDHKHETVELRLFIHHETDAAYLVSETGDDDKAVWVPKSQLKGEHAFVKNGCEMLDCGVPEWLALEKGFT